MYKIDYSDLRFLLSATYMLYIKWSKHAIAKILTVELY